MDLVDISNLIREQIAASGALTNSHGVELDRCLVTPTPIQVIHRSVRTGKDSIEPVWLVLEEKPGDGYKIVFREQYAAFGLAAGGFPGDKHPILCGWYGDFPITLASM